jgi:hypothetical protein
VRIIEELIGPILTINLWSSDPDLLVRYWRAVWGILPGEDPEVSARDVSQTDETSLLILYFDLVTPDLEIRVCIVVTPGLWMSGQVGIVECGHVEPECLIDRGDPVPVILILTKLEIHFGSAGVDISQQIVMLTNIVSGRFHKAYF